MKPIQNSVRKTSVQTTKSNLLKTKLHSFTKYINHNSIPEVFLENSILLSIWHLSTIFKSTQFKNERRRIANTKQYTYSMRIRVSCRIGWPSVTAPVRANWRRVPHGTGDSHRVPGGERPAFYLHIYKYKNTHNIPNCQSVRME